MRIVIIGANSAVGKAILRCGPDEIVAGVRSDRAANQIRTQLREGQTVAVMSYDDPANLDAAFQNASAVIHLAGILVERPGSSYEQANVASARSVVEAAKRCGVRKIVLVSSTGADERSSNRYYRSKGQAEALVRGSGLLYTILRAPILLGPATEGSAALKRNATQPKAKLIGGGRHIQQPLHVDDLARAALAVSRGGTADNCVLDMVGPVALTERELVERAAHSLGREVRIGSISKSLLRIWLAIRQRVAGPGFSVDVLEVITESSRFDPTLAAAASGIQLTGIDQTIRHSLGEEKRNR